jgi:hypothetical protein
VLELLPVKFVSPPYAAEIEWVPSARMEVKKVALPPLSDPVPICTPRS